MRQNRWTWLLLLLGASCIVTKTSVTPSTSARSRSPSPTPAFTACETAQLHLREAESASEATGQHTALFTLENRARRPCSLFGYPTIALLDDKGEAIPFRYQDKGDQMLTGAPPKPVDLAYGARAYFAINKYRCDIGEKLAAATIRVTPPGTSTITLELKQYRNWLCFYSVDDPGSLVRISPIEPTYRAIYPTP